VGAAIDGLCIKAKKPLLFLFLSNGFKISLIFRDLIKNKLEI
jgi:hypothetical protein